MRKYCYLFVFFMASFTTSRADEGMWLPLLLGNHTYNEMVKKGLRLKPDQLFSMNKASIKDAIVIFGGGCTGEIVSSKGLLFTNHHCGYDAIATASSVEANYLKDGFWAKDFSKEIKTEISVRFLDSVADVTDNVMKELGDLQGKERATKFNEIRNKMIAAIVGNNEFKAANIVGMFKDNQYFLFVYKLYKDVRLVGTPPENIGKFGGDTDNWEWPRHTGDFSVFRVYMAKDGSPAKYNADNVPYAPKYHLPVSIKGIKNGSFTMIFGYPGGTNRYEVSYGIKLATDINNPNLVKLRAMRLNYMLQEMKKDPAVKLQLASNYASIANYWKFFDGETKQLLKFDVKTQKEKEEITFTTWAANKPKYANIFKEYAENYALWMPYAQSRQYFNEGIMGSNLLAYTASWARLETLLKKKNYTPEELKKIMEELDAARTRFLKNTNKKSDQNILATGLAMYFLDIDKTQHPKGFYENLVKNYPDTLNQYKQYAQDIFASTMAFDDAKWAAFKANPSEVALDSDLAYATAKAFTQNYTENILPRYQNFVFKNNDLGRIYMQGLFEMNPAKMKNTYPDANFTMRISYGTVQDYNPKDGVHYNYITTMDGIAQKYVPGDYEFDAPEQLLSLHKAKKYGQYRDSATGRLVVNFITTNDITGGNSGSPVLDGKGNLIGLAFDGNYEALSHKLIFDKDLNRTICLDIRYVLWCIDVLGGAKNIIDELKIVK